MREQLKMVESMYGRKLVIQALIMLMGLGILSILGLVKFFEIMGGLL